MAEEQGQGSSLRQREGGLPRWGWIGLAAAVGVVGLVWYQSRKASQATASQTPTDISAQGLDTGQYESLLALLRDIQGNASQPTGTGTMIGAPIPGPNPTTPPTGPPLTPVPVPNNPRPLRPTQQVLVKEGKNLNELLAFYGMTRQDFEAQNPGIGSTYRPYIAGRGYVQPGTPYAQTVLNLGTDRLLNVWAT